MLYSQALLAATYKDGKTSKRTEEHEKAEFHRFKTDYLFKNKKIPKALYVARLIQHFLIIEAIEKQLQSLSNTNNPELSPFFALSYLEHLWRTPGIKDDLIQLGINPDTINAKEIAPTTKQYIDDIKQLAPKPLLAHFLLHVAGFMHGGNIIRSKYIDPSNRLTKYKIPSKQYDFSSAASSITSEEHSSLFVYKQMMREIDHIELNEAEYKNILEQGKAVYETMSNIYDDLCDMHINHSNLACYLFAVVTVSLFALAYVLNLFTPMIELNMSHGPT